MADTPLRHNAQVAGKLDRYRSMRDLDASPEPSGAADQEEASGSARFVIQEHHARRLHWDLRLERDGVLASWALPRGIPGHPKENRLAVRTEDHPLEYLTFQGEIPKGTYGAGTMEVWDSGTYLCEKFREDEVMVTLRGERVSGRYVLFRTRGKDWMIHRMDPPADPSAEPMPDAIAPMLARDGRLPRDDAAHGYEIKWDGVRAIARVDAGHLTLAGRNGSDFSGRYPEIRALADDQGSRRMVLDGEVVAFDPDGRPSFERLQSRMHLGSDSAVRRRLRDIPVTYVVFDVLWLQGHSTLALPVPRPPQAAAESGPEWPDLAYARAPRGRWRGPARGERGAASRGNRGQAAGLALRAGAPLFEPGSRSRTTACRSSWSAASRQVAGAGRRPWVRWRSGSTSGPESGGLLYAGKVGTGFTEATMGMLIARAGAAAVLR